MRLENKIVLVTGGGTGIGRATAELFAKEGAKIAISGRRVEKLEEVVQLIATNGGDAICIPGDVSNMESTKQMVSETLAKWKRLDILVNCAGVIDRSEIHEMSLEKWNSTMDVNVKGVYLVCKFAIPEMIRGGGGSIINMASISGVVGASDSHAYSASKGAVINLTRAMAISYGPNNIRVNAVSPGMVDTAMSRARAKWKEVFVSKAKEYPLSRIGHPIDIAYGCLYLASGESSWVTGTNLVIDGGFTAQ